MPRKNKAVMLAGWLTMALGLLVMTGWKLQINPLITIHPDWVPMQFNTALCFFMLGAGVIACTRKQKIICRALAWGCFAIAIITGAQYLTGANYGIDQLFNEHYITQLTPSPGRMAPNTALVFGLHAIALVLVRIRPILSMLLAAYGTMMGAHSLSGYVLSISGLYHWSPDVTAMAVHTALGALLSGVGLGLCSAYRLRKGVHVK